ncbi:MAG: aminotransferase class I/II-fold pyridoxal phosphate-dependent enzyme, partial [Pseudomonadota bacterium]
RRFRLIATDGVFYMDWTHANLTAIFDISERYDALVIVDYSHSVGFMGPDGAGTPSRFGVSERVDIYTGTLGKALGGASGGYTSGNTEVIEWLRQRSRPYLFSNSLAPAVASAGVAALALLSSSATLRNQLHANSAYFRDGLSAAGFELVPGEHPIIPVMLGDARLANDMANRLLELGVYVIGFSFPVVPHGQARIRTQMSAAHTTEQLDRALLAFTQAGRELGVIT